MSKIFSVIVFVFIGITSFGQTISTMVGNGTAGYSGDGSVSTSAKITKPYDQAIDGLGNIYVADATNNVIRKVTKATGMISTIAGNGTAAYSGDGGLATSAQLNFPEGITVDASNNLYIADTKNNVIRKIDASTGVITTIAGNGTAGNTGDGSVATLAELQNPVDVAVDVTGNIFICDNGNFVIRKVTKSTGIISTYAGNGIAAYSGNGGIATAASFINPFHICFDQSGNLFVADNSSCSVIRRIDAGTTIIRTVAGSGVSGFGADGLNSLSAKLNYPTGVSVDNLGNIYISDYLNNRIRLIDVKTGWIKTIAGNGYAGYSGDGSPSTGAMINAPMSVVVDNAFNVLFADFNNNVVREFNSSSLLPLVLIEFTGTTSPIQNTLDWKTSDEVGSQSFEIEASLNGLDFNAIGTISAKGGGDYSYSDTKPLGTRTFYRLKMIDIDGQFAYSPIISLLNSIVNNKITVFPNPVLNSTTIDLGNNPTTINSQCILYSTDGKAVIKTVLSSNKTLMDMSNLIPGTYFLKVNDTQVIKLTKL